MASNGISAPSAPPSAAGPNSAGSVSFKAYLVEKGMDKPKEVRRFGMEQNEVTSFELLKKKLRQVFPSLAGNEFSIGWKDFEDDDIIISSNEELLTALTETSEQVRRLYLTIKNPITVKIQTPIEWKPIDIVMGVNQANPTDAIDSDDDDDEEEEMPFTTLGCKRSWQSALRGSAVKHHPYVYCDGCNKHISGHRYKCMECDDFDLCPDCESQNLHKEHIMLRIPLTMSHYTKLNHFSKSMRYMSDTLHKIENRIKKQERRMHKSYEGNVTCEDLYSFALGSEIPNSKRCKRDDKEKDKKEKDKREKRDKKDKRDCKMGPCGSSAAASCGSQAPKPKESSSPSAEGTCPFPASILRSFLNPQTIGNLLSPQNLTTLQQIFEQMSPVPEQLLQEVSQNLADVRLSDQAPAASGPANPPGNPFSVNAKKSVPTSEPDGPAPSTSSTPPPTPATSRKDSQNEEQPQAQGAAQPEAAAMSHSNNSQEGASAAGNSQPQSGRSSRSSSEEADPEGWTVLDPQVREGSGDQSSVYPKLPQVEPTPEHQVPPRQVAPQSTPTETVQMPLHRDLDVQNCLRALTEMGYDVREPMIIDLAEEYKGNVSRVLNALLS